MPKHVLIWHDKETLRGDGKIAPCLHPCLNRLSPAGPAGASGAGVMPQQDRSKALGAAKNSSKDAPPPPQMRRRSRKDPRRDATWTALVDTAEAMFAQAGIDGVSLRQIGAAIGSANANVVGYYFGDKAALIEAILLKHRLPVEATRAKLLEKAKQEGRERDLPALLNVLWRPLLDQKNPQGLHTYAAFLGSITRTSHYALRLALNDRFPTTQEVVNRIAALVPHVPEKYFRGRVQVLGDLITGVLQRIDFNGEDEAAAELLYADALQMAHAMFTAPLGNSGLNAPLPSIALASIVFV